MNFGDPKTLAILLVGLLSGLGVLLAVLRSPGAAIAAICGMVIFSSLAAHDTTTYSNNVWLRPLQLNRAELYLACGCIALLGVLIHIGGMSFKHPPLQGVLLLGINMFAGFLEMYHRGPTEGLQRIAFSAATIGPLLFLVPSLLEKDERHFLGLLRAVGFAGAFWAFGIVVQMGIDRSQMILSSSNRFTGMLGNPQGTAVYLGPMCAVLAWLVLNESDRRLRLLWVGATGVMLVALLWTGSRTGALMFLFGLTGVLYARAGRAIFFLPIIAAGALGLFQLIAASGINIGYGVDRLLSGQDTRTEVWLVLIEDAVNSPLLGMGDERKGGVENSYLLGWVVYGPVMMLVMVFFTLLSMGLCLRLMLVRGRLNARERSLADFVLAFNAMYFAGAHLEWYILARVDSTIVLMCVMGAIGERLIRVARERSLGVWGSTDAVVYDEFETPSSVGEPA